jgi:hypothetical protein
MDTCPHCRAAKRLGAGERRVRLAALLLCLIAIAVVAYISTKSGGFNQQGGSPRTPDPKPAINKPPWQEPLTRDAIR